MLQRPISELKFNNLPLVEALAVLSDLTKVNIVADWKLLDGLDIQQATRVNLQLRDVTLERALKEICRGLPHRFDPCKFFIADGVVTVTSLEPTMRPPLTTVMIDVRPLLDELWGDHSLRNSPGDQGRNDIAASRPSSGSPQNNWAGRTTYTEMMEQMIVVVMNCVDPDSWADYGGFGRIYRLGSVLVISSTPGVIQHTRDALGSIYGTARATNWPGSTTLPSIRYFSIGSNTSNDELAVAPQTCMECFNIDWIHNEFGMDTHCADGSRKGCCLQLAIL